MMADKEQARERNKGGRPAADFDKSIFEGLCSIQATRDEICKVFHTTDKTLVRWVKRTYGAAFDAVFDRYRIDGLMSLRRVQFDLAQKSATMAIYLGKVYLGQTDTPIEHKMKQRQLDIMEMEAKAAQKAAGMDDDGADDKAAMEEARAFFDDFTDEEKKEYFRLETKGQATVERKMRRDEPKDNGLFLDPNDSFADMRTYNLSEFTDEEMSQYKALRVKAIQTGYKLRNPGCKFAEGFDYGTTTRDNAPRREASA